MNPIFTRQSPRIFSIFWLFLFFLFLGGAAARAESGRYHLDISFLPEEASLQGTATITYPAGQAWQLYTGDMKIQQFTLQEEGGPAIVMPLPRQNVIAMYGSEKSQLVTLRYSLTVAAGDNDNMISPRGIVLAGNWHPLPDRAMLFSLRAQLPPGFHGISESDMVPRHADNTTMESVFSQPLQAIHLAAGPYRITEEEVRPGLSLSTWFFAEDQQLSRSYLDAGKNAILRYEKEIGPFPYSHYAIVANRLPSGFGMPTFTLLGQMVLRLPFIKETSLPHEIVHSWFGNSIEVAANSGNWCEGLTSYLADYAADEARGEGAAHRRAGLINYQNYVHPDNAITLQEFRSASHHQPLAKAIRAVGYNRSAMFFHQLQGLLGPEDFFGGVRLFASTWQGRNATWKSIQATFEKASGQDLQLFFQQRLTEKGNVSLSATGISSEDQQDKTLLHFTLKQEGIKPQTLQVPIRVTTMSGEEYFRREITAQETAITLPLAEPPLSFTIDPDYDLFRQLDPSERTPVWSQFMGAQKKLLIKADGEISPAYTPVLAWAEKEGWTVSSDSEVTNQQLSEHSILFLGTDSASCRSLFGPAQPPQDGFSLSSYKNPLNAQEIAVIFNSSDSDETEAALGKLRHYGKYSSLFFQRGRIKEKKIRPSDDGIHYILESLPGGTAASAIKSFAQILEELGSKRVIYLGETHNSVADHLLQLRIIQGLKNQGRDLVLAMEMFPGSSQQALDDYILGGTDMDETSFLRSSRWFDVWRYDWRLFRPIFNFCRQERIPVYGINVPRKIVSTVYDDGHTDGLSAEQKEAIAPERDLLLDGYVKRLSEVHGFHAESPHGKQKGIAGFVQSQAIWDESMAENIAAILRSNPDKTVVVIAGSQHTRKDSGIPPRVSRRIEVPQASVLNIYAGNPPTSPEQQADYLFMAEEGSLPAKGKIGVMLDPKKDDDGSERLIIKGLSHAGKAKEAGIMEGDIIVAINGCEAKNMEDVGILMMDSKPGDHLKLTVLRKKEEGDAEKLELSVTLSDMTKPAMHP